MPYADPEKAKSRSRQRTASMTGSERAERADRSAAWARGIADHLGSYKKQWRKENPDKVQQQQDRYAPKRPEYNLRRYGLTVAERNAIAEKQDHKCPICQHERKLHVDHDHKTGAVRGLLCLGCNTSLGKFEDDPTILLRAIAYLKGEI